MRHRDPPKPGQVLVCRPYITVKGRRIYARDRGKEAFCFWADPNKRGD